MADYTSAADDRGYPVGARVGAFKAAICPLYEGVEGEEAGGVLVHVCGGIRERTENRREVGGPPGALEALFSGLNGGSPVLLSQARILSPIVGGELSEIIRGDCRRTCTQAGSDF